MNGNCLRVRSSIARWVDGDVSSETAAWLENHWQQCAECRTVRDRFLSFDRQLVSTGEGVRPADHQAQFLLRVGEVERSSRWIYGLIPAAALLAAAMVLGVWMPGHGPQTRGIGDSDFVAVPFVPPIAPYERTTVVRMQIPVAELLAEGYAISADPSSVVQADVLFGEDWRMHAVRLASNQIIRPVGE